MDGRFTSYAQPNTNRFEIPSHHWLNSIGLRESVANYELLCRKNIQPVSEETRSEFRTTSDRNYIMDTLLIAIAMRYSRRIVPIRWESFVSRVSLLARFRYLSAFVLPILRRYFVFRKYFFSFLASQDEQFLRNIDILDIFLFIREK